MIRECSRQRAGVEQAARAKQQREGPASGHIWMLLELVREMFRVHIALYGEDGALRPLIAQWSAIGARLIASGHVKEPE
jgi:hypothetical protein